MALIGVRTYFLLPWILVKQNCTICFTLSFAQPFVTAFGYKPTFHHLDNKIVENPIYKTLH